MKTLRVNWGESGDQTKTGNHRPRIDEDKILQSLSKKKTSYDMNSSYSIKCIIWKYTFPNLVDMVDNFSACWAANHPPEIN